MSLVKLEPDRQERGVLSGVLSRRRMHSALLPELLAAGIAYVWGATVVAWGG